MTKLRPRNWRGSHRSMRLQRVAMTTGLCRGFLLCIALLGFGVAAIRPAHGVIVTHNGSIVFNSLGFEKDVSPGPPGYPDVGSWRHSRDLGTTSDGGSMLVTTAVSPGAYQGSQYHRLVRVSEDVFSDALLSGAAVSSGTLHIEWMCYIPAGSNTAFNAMVLPSDLAGNPGAGVCIDGAGKVRVLNNTGTAWVNTLLPYGTNQWQKWSIDWTIGQSTMLVTVGASSVSVAARVVPPAISLMRLVTPGGGAEFFVDSPAANTVAPFEISDITWTLGPDHPTYRKGGAAGFLQGRFISAGGCDFPWAEAATVYSYTPGATGWIQLPSLPQGRCYMDGTTVGEAMFVPGGRFDFQTRTTTYRLRLVTGNWVWDQVSNLNTHRGYFSLARVGSRIALAGGIQGSGQPPYSENTTMSSAEWYDTAGGGGWESLPNFSVHSRAGAILAGAAGKVYMYGGVCFDCPSGQNESLRISDGQVYDPATNQWTNLPKLPFGLSGGDAVTYRDRYIIIVGGAAQFSSPQLAAWPQVAGYYSNVVLVYDTREKYFRVMPSLMPYGTGDIRSALDGDTLYAMGGENIDPATSNTSKWFRIGQIHTLTPSVPGDFDFDGDVDQKDFAHLQLCLTGPLVTPAAGCEDADLTNDALVEQGDVVIFLNCMSGAGVGGDPGCAG